MAATFIAIVIVFTIFLTFNVAAKTQSNVTRGSSLTPTGDNTSWLSPSGLYAFGFYPQTTGYAVGIYIAGIPERPVVWTASRDNLPLSNTSTLRFTNSGSLVVDQTQAQQITISDSVGASFASMQDSGNFVLYDSDGSTVLWQTFDHPTDTILPGQRLEGVSGQTLYPSVSETNHSIGIFQLCMQRDGNLVGYPNVGTPEDGHGTAFWASGTVGMGPNVTLNLGSDGFLYLLQNSTYLIRNLTQGGYTRQEAIYRMKIDVDGIIRLYSHDLSNKSRNGSVIWSSSQNKCVGTGLCGLNGYCELKNDAAQCKCLPGFEVVNPNLRSLGCQRNYTVERCKIADAGISFQMTTVRNARWQEATYAIPKASTEQECSFACLNDCNCQAALLSGRECMLQRLPLRYMQVVADEPNVGFIKVYASSPNNASDPTNSSIQVIKKTRRMGILVIGVSLISFSVLILILSGVIMCRAQVWAYKKISTRVNVQLSNDFGPRAFSYAELERMTVGFKEELGRGSFGIVYKGILESSNKTVAVKKLKEELAQEGEREFQTEMKVIARTNHRNLTRLIGYCCEGPERLLVFEYMTKGSLADMFFGSQQSKPCWTERIKMAVDIARGMQYLHEECETAIIHCDIKPQNILIDEYGCAKISDFGLAKLLEHDQTKTSTLIRGTRGYAAPEWHKRQAITIKVDVYSFGIVLFEILCCRKHVDNNLPANEAVLVEWVYDCYEVNQLSKLVSDETVDKNTLDRMIKVGLWCIQEDPSLRPSMKLVVLMLEGTVKIPVPPNPASFLSVV